MVTPPSMAAKAMGNEQWGMKSEKCCCLVSSLCSLLIAICYNIINLRILFEEFLYIVPAIVPVETPRRGGL